VIKPGTLCVVVYCHPAWQAKWLGKVCTIVGGSDAAYKAKLPNKLDGYLTLSGSRRCFMPLNDPDNAPARDIKRRTTV